LAAVIWIFFGEELLNIWIGSGSAINISGY